MTTKKLQRRPAPSKALVVRKPPARHRAAKPARQELVLSSEAAAMLANPIRSAQERVTLEPPMPPQRHLTDDIDVGDYGQVEVEFSEKENEVLNEPVREEDVQILPTGQVYLQHTTYTRWLNRALGRGKWALVQDNKITRVERPNKQGELKPALIQHFTLWVHGKPAARAWGEQAYHENNDDQTYGDAAEALNAFALRRCCKRLGIGLELWDKDWIDGWIHRNAIRVATRSYDGRVFYRWRKRSGPPLKDEVNEQKDQEPREERRRPPAAAPPSRPHADGHGDQPISDAQKQRLWTIASHAKRTNAEVKEWLAKRGIDSSSQIKRKDYDEIIRAIEAPGPLGGGREPGQEG